MSNLPDSGKAAIDAVQVVVEPDLVYPLLRARDVGRWRANPEFSILIGLAECSRSGHEAVLRSKLDRLPEIETELDRMSASLWGLTPKESDDLRLSLAEEQGEARMITG